MLNSEMFLYADDTKVFRKIKDKGNCEKLQDLKKIKNWSHKWLLIRVTVRNYKISRKLKIGPTSGC